jgi:preprotein translocase subunit SecG
LLAFLFGYTFSTFPLVKAGLGVGAALTVVFAADTLSIATMEVVDNTVMAVIPGAMEAGLVNSVFWVSMMIALTVAFLAAYPVNRYLLARGKGHALTHAYHGDTGPVTAARRYIPNLSSTTLAAAIIAFMLGGLVVSTASDMGADEPKKTDHAAAPSSVRSPLRGIFSRPLLSNGCVQLMLCDNGSHDPRARRVTSDPGARSRVSGCIRAG